MSNELVSVIVAIYNVDKQLEKCIDSIVNQTYLNIEIILVNDGSTDFSLEICREWQAKDTRIIIIDQENQGVSSARNQGIINSHGEWLCFVDGDDWIEKDCIEKLVSKADNLCDVIISDYYEDNNGDTRSKAFLKLPDTLFCSKEEKKDLIANCIIRTSQTADDTITLIGVPWAKLYRATFIKSNNIYFDVELKKMQDAIFNFDVFYNAKEVLYFHDHVYHYVQIDSSVTHKANKDYKKIADLLLQKLWGKIEYYKMYDLIDVYNAKQFMSVLECVKFIYILDQRGIGYAATIRGIKELFSKLEFSDQESRDVYKRLWRYQKIAFVLYKLGMYNSIYLASKVYLSRK